MYKGLLRITGTIDLGQFWPTKRSDADTTTVRVDDGEEAIRFRRSAGADFEPTAVFEDAIVSGKTKKACINKKTRHITIRLQGIDAMELHYRATAAVKAAERTDEQKDLFRQYNHSYRQYSGETAAVALHDKLAEAGENLLPCTVETAVDHPYNVFDTYGRLVGDILVRIDRKLLDVNQWLVESGYAVPTFYDSMSRQEIDTFIRCAKNARNSRLGIWNGIYTDRIEPFDFDLVERKKADAGEDDDRGSAILPKLFRRQTVFEVNRMAGMLDGTFAGYIRSQRSANKLLRMKEFLAKGSKAKKEYLDTYVTDEAFLARPEDLVFIEAPSRLIGPDKKEITTWH